MKKITILSFAFVFMIITQNVFGQEITWHLKAENNGVKIYTKQVNCDGLYYFVLKVENNTATTTNVNYVISIKDNPTLPPTISGVINSIASGESVESSCTNLIDKLWVPSASQATDESFDISIISE